MIELHFIDLEHAAPASIHRLDDEERARALRYLDPAVAARFVARRTALRRTLASLLDVEADSLRFGRGLQGKPHLIDHRALNFSVSGRQNWLMVVTSRSVEVGCDIEAERHSAELFGALAATGRGQNNKPIRTSADPLSAWTLQEARLKALGTGFASDSPVDRNVEIRDAIVDAPVGFQAAVAWLSDMRSQVVIRASPTLG